MLDTLPFCSISFSRLVGKHQPAVTGCGVTNRTAFRSSKLKPGSHSEDGLCRRATRFPPWLLGFLLPETGPLENSMRQQKTNKNTPTANAVAFPTEPRPSAPQGTEQPAVEFEPPPTPGFTLEYVNEGCIQTLYVADPTTDYVWWSDLDLLAEDLVKIARGAGRLGITPEQYLNRLYRDWFAKADCGD